MVDLKRLPRNAAGQIQVYDIATQKMLWTQPVDAREGIERGQFLVDEPSSGGEKKTAEVAQTPQRTAPPSGPQRRKAEKAAD